MNGRTGQKNNRYLEKVGKPRFTFKGVYVVRTLVGLLLALNIILIYVVFFSSNGLSGYRKQNGQVKDLEEKILNLRTENQKLFEMIQSLKQNPEAQEKLVRQELGWVRENEVVLETVEGENEGAEKPAAPLKAPGPAK